MSRANARFASSNGSDATGPDADKVSKEALRSTPCAGRIGRDRLFGAGDRIVIGLSGGADSVTLSVLLPDVAREFGAEVVALAHLNHGLRPGAEDDQRFCGEFAARLGLPFRHGNG